MRRLTLFLLLFLAWTPIAVHADDAPPATIEQVNARLDRTRATLDEIHKTLEDNNLSDRALHQLRDRIDPMRRELEETIDLLTPRLAAVEARLKELAPAANKPADAPPPAAAPPAPPTPAAAPARPIAR